MLINSETFFLKSVDLQIKKIKRDKENSGVYKADYASRAVVLCLI